MSTSVHFRFERDEWADLDRFNVWAKANGFTPPTTEHSQVWRTGEVEMDLHPSLRMVTFSTYYLGPETPELIRRALNFWFSFGGSMQAAVEIRSAIYRAHPVPQEAKS